MTGSDLGLFPQAVAEGKAIRVIAELAALLTVIPVIPIDFSVPIMGTSVPNIGITVRIEPLSGIPPVMAVSEMTPVMPI